MWWESGKWKNGGPLGGRIFAVHCLFLNLCERNTYSEFCMYKKKKKAIVEGSMEYFLFSSEIISYHFRDFLNL